MARTIADLAGSDQIQTAHVADFFAPLVPGGGAAIQAEGNDAVDEFPEQRATQRG
jgi:hypothetical protein